MVSNTLRGAIGGAALLAAGPLLAGTLTVDFNFEFSGAVPPDGPAPFMSVTFDDGGTPGTVTMTVETSGLIAPESVHQLYFNIDPALNATNLNFAYLGGTAPEASKVSTGVDKFKADGDGKYDILFDFPASAGFDAGETLIYEISGIASLTADSFNFFSAPAGGNGPFVAAAHVQNTGADDSGSGWLAGEVSVVPVPGAVWLFGSGLLSLVGFARARRAA